MKQLCVLFLALFCTFEAHPVYFKHIGIKEGLSQISVMSIYQDELGRMWFGTEEGICMYNGDRIQSFKHSNSSGNQTGGLDLLGNENFPIVGDGDGSLFFVSDHSALIRYDMRGECFEKLIPLRVGTVQFSDSCIWVGVGDSLKIWNKELGQAELRLVIKDKPIQKIIVSKEREVWLGTKSGLYRVRDGKTPELEIPNADIYDLFEDSKGNIWIGTRESGMYLRGRDGAVKPFVHDPADPSGIPSNHIRSFTEDTYGNIWIGTFMGLVVYNPSKQTFTVHAKDNLPGSLQHSSVFSLFKDKQGTIWIGTYYGGVHYLNPEMDIFTFYSANPERDDCLSNHFVGKMVEDNDNNVWICTEGGGLNFFDRKTRRFTHYQHEAGRNTISHDNLKSICFSPSRNKLYIGTHTGGLSVFDIRQNTFRNFPVIQDETKTYVSDVVNHVELYDDRYLIMLTRAGILKMDVETEVITNLFDGGATYSASMFHLDSKGNLWLAQGSNIRRINMADPGDFSLYRGKEEGFGGFRVLTIFEDRKGRILFGTRGSGLIMFDPETNRFTQFKAEENQLLSNYCYEIAQSTQGYLIVSGDKGLSLLDPENKTYRAIELESALPVSGINLGCGLLVCRNSEVFIGGINGLATFFEESLLLPPKDYELYFSSLYVNNDYVSAYGSGGTIHEAIPFNEKIRLKHNQNNLIVAFASNNYLETTAGTECEYKLEGFDDKWVTAKNHEIAYTNLNPGKYTLYVREKDVAEHIRRNQLQMAITIEAPWYAGPVAYIAYCLLIILGVYSFYRFKQSQLLLRASLEYERKEKAKIEELNQEKIQFFSNISHEFRTPLTLIISQIELMIQGQKLAPAIYNKLIKVYKHSYQMLTLVSELLDFRKLDQGYKRLKIANGNFVSFAREVYHSFVELASKEQISYRFSVRSEEIMCWFDRQQMQKVISNLLSNAFKFTKRNGVVEFVIEEDEDHILIKIIDDGAGIEQADLPKVFDTFYQGTNQPKGSNSTIGSGLGLSLAKNIVTLHHGEIDVESKPGYGSVFIVRLKKGNRHFEEDTVLYEPDDNAEEPETDAYAVSNGYSPAEVEEASLAIEKDTYTILIIEDNEELLRLLSSIFAPVYLVILARNGKEGLRLAREQMPDIILSDVMMPEMTGTEMCMHIKNDYDLCHIPVVLLTALNSPEQNIEGLSRGADAYISKPFDSRVLMTRCNSIIRNRILLRKKFSGQQEFDASTLAANPVDQQFLDTIHRIVSENLANEAFDVKEMARQLGLSRSSFYTKFKGLTGMTPNEFVLEYKLKQSAVLIDTKPEMQISDIATMLGFGSPRYFSRVFKARYNMSPAEYRNRKRSG